MTWPHTEEFGLTVKTHYTQSDSVTPLPSQTSANPHRPQDEISMTEPASPSHISYHPPPQLSCPSQAFEHTIFSLQILYRVVPLPETVFLPSIFAWKGPGNFPLSLQISNTASFEKSLWAGVGVTMAAALTGLGLRSVKQVRVQFCSFEKNVESTRTFHQAVSREKVRGANLSCSVTVDVRPSGRRRLTTRSAPLSAHPARERLAAFASHIRPRAVGAGMSRRQCRRGQHRRNQQTDFNLRLLRPLI